MPSADVAHAGARRVLVTGAAGQLGSFVVQAFADREVIALTRSSLDITDPAAVASLVRETGPDLIVNCAAFNNVDGAEDAPTEAIAINALAVRSLARAAEATGATLVHYSSDFVINANGPEPFEEDVRPSPRGVYASSKLLGEWFAQEAPRAYVLRVESLFGSPKGWAGRRGTVDNIVDGILEGREVKVFTDRIVSPSYSKDVAAATRHLVTSGAAPGLYHCVNSGHASWHDVAREAVAILGRARALHAVLVPVTVDQVPLRAPRPKFCALSPRKLAAAGFEMPTWQDALGRWLANR